MVKEDFMAGNNYRVMAKSSIFTGFLDDFGYVLVYCSCSAHFSET